jgi:hypothetical protein
MTPAQETKLEQKRRLLKAKIAVAIQDETGKVPTKEKIEEVFFLARVMYKAVLGTHYRRNLLKNKPYAHRLRPGFHD